VTVESPCVRVCTLDESGRTCLGCFRTLDEIGMWSQLTDNARRLVIEQAAFRRRAHAARIGPASSFCEACGEEFACGANDATQPCWCAAHPPVTPSGAAARCLCPACLAAAAERQESHG
jgi:predicted Fe-S protein YdhL (DUF1289 family)